MNKVFLRSYPIREGNSFFLGKYLHDYRPDRFPAEKRYIMSEKNLKITLGECLENVHAKTPLVHNITNYVTVNDVANVLLACGGYGKFDNAAFRIDHAILALVLPEGSSWVANPSHYTWFSTSLMFAAMTFAGYHATQMLVSGKAKWRRASELAVYGATLLAIGLASEIWIPCIKPIFTLSFTCEAMGWCVLSLAGLYVVNDILMLRRGLGFILFFGRMALAAYFISHFFAPVLRAAARLFGDGIVSYLPSSASPFALAFFEVASLVASMVIWRKAKAGNAEMRRFGEMKGA